MKNQITLKECYSNLRVIRKDEPKLKNGYYSLARHLIALALNNSNANTDDCSLVTNNVALAREFNCANKTIYNQITRLIEIGIINDKTSTRKNITLELNKSIFTTKEKKLPQLVSTRTNSKIQDLRSNVGNLIGQKNHSRAQELSAEHTNHEKCPYSYNFLESAKEMLYRDISVSKGEEVIITRYAYNYHFKNLPENKKQDRLYFLQQKMVQAKDWTDMLPCRYIPTPHYYFTISDQGVRFSRFLKYAGKKKIAEKNSQTIYNINLQAKKLRDGKSDESKMEMMRRHAAIITESKSSKLKKWYLKNAPKLYSTWS